METHFAYPPTGESSATDAHDQDSLPDTPNNGDAAANGSSDLTKQLHSIGADVIDRAELASQAAAGNYAEAVAFDRHSDVVHYDQPYPVGTRLQVQFQRLENDSTWRPHGSISGTTMASMSSSGPLPAGSVRLMPDTPLPSTVPTEYRTQHPRSVGIETEPFWYALDEANKMLLRRVVSVEGRDANAVV